MDGKEFTEYLKKKVDEEGENSLLYGKKLVYIPEGSRAEQELKQLVFRLVNWKYFQEEADELLGDFLAVMSDKNDCMLMVWLGPILQCAKELGVTEALMLLKTHLERNMKLNSLELIRSLTDYEKTAPNLILRPMFLDPEDRETEHGIYWRMGDLGLFLYLEVPSSDQEVVTTVRITEEIFEDWHLDMETVLSAALENTRRKAPAILGTDLEFMLLGKDISETGEEEPFEFSRKRDFCILTHKKRVNGAIALFYPGMLEKIYQMFGDDYYVVFMSIHECALHRVDQADQEHLREILAEINETFNPGKEKLSEKVYRYNGKLKKLVPADEEEA